MTILITNIVVLVFFSIKSSIKGDSDAKLFTTGAFITAFFGIYDILQEMRVIPRGVFVSHWGLFIFILCIGYILGNRISRINKSLKSYSEELELKNITIRQDHQEMEILYKEIEITQKEVIFRLSEVAEARSKETGKSRRDIFSAASIVAYEHHERFNGSGYPRKLKERDIYIFGRITAVADVFDSLASDRCYKRAWELDKILEFMEKEKGRQFDPDLITVMFINLDKFLSVRDKFKDEYQL
jgi:hypothetical protein